MTNTYKTSVQRVAFHCLDCNVAVTPTSDVQGMTHILDFKSGKTYPNKLCSKCRSERMRKKNYGYPSMTPAECWWTQGYDKDQTDD